MLTQKQIMAFFQKIGFTLDPQFPIRLSHEYGEKGDRYWLVVNLHPNGTTDAYSAYGSKPTPYYVKYWRIDPCPDRERLQEIFKEMMDTLPVLESKK